MDRNLTTDPKAIATQELVRALEEFKKAATKLDEAWERANPHADVKRYPPHWHSFDEELEFILDMSVETTR